MANWMDLENIMLSEISHRKTNDVGFHLYVESKGKKKQNKKKKKSLPHRYTEQTGGYQRQGVWNMGEGGQIVQASSYKMNKF